MMLDRHLNTSWRYRPILQIKLWTIVAILAAWSWQAAWAEVRVEHRIIPGKTFLVSDGTTYDAGKRFRVSRQHRIPGDMVVQGDTVELTAKGDGLDQDTQGQWRLVRGWGKAKLIFDPQNPRVAKFVADGYGVNEIAFEAVVDGKDVTCGTKVFVEFSTDNMLVSGQTVSLPANAPQNPFIDEVDQKIRDHREQVTARNPNNGRLVTMWQVKFGTGDAHPMGVATMTSDDHGITWKNRQYVYRHTGDNSGWGSLGWSPGGNDGKGEFLLWTCSHVRSPKNRIMLFRSRDDGRSWQHAGDYQQAVAKEFGQPNALMTYFGVNRTISTLRGALVSPMACKHGVRVIRSEDNGRTWQGSNLDKSFPEGNEDALVETIDGGRLILMARRSGNNNRNRRFESVDGGITWKARQDTTLPTARVNFGLDKIVEPGTPEHGQVVYASAASRILPHGRRQLVVALNRDPFEVTRDKWDVRLLWDTFCNYSDVLYLPDDKSLLITVETLRPGRTKHSCAAIRYFKMSLRYWRALPTFTGTSGGSPSQQKEKKKVSTRAKSPSPFAAIKDNPKLPRILLIGDSISIGYTLPTRAALAGKANVHRPPTNCTGTPNIVRHLYKWLSLGQGRWDVIHFNSGIHDIKRPGGKRVVTPQQYEKNLRIIVERLKKTGAALIWCSTTQSPEAVCGAPAEDFITYNAIAAKIMTENGIPINDLYGFSLPRLHEIQIPVNSHFTSKGSKVLATQVSSAILKALETRKPKR